MVREEILWFHFISTRFDYIFFDIFAQQWLIGQYKIRKARYIILFLHEHSSRVKYMMQVVYVYSIRR